MNPYAERLSAVRSLMIKKGLDFIVIPMSDPHPGEQVPDHWQIIRWLTGFTGSAATLVITNTFAGLWTDSRYFIQARRQLAGSGFQFVKPGEYQRNDYMDFVAENAGPHDTVGIDGKVFPVSDFRRLKKRLEEKKTRIETELTIIDELWSDRPDLPFSTAFEHSLEYAGIDRQVKIDQVREHMESMNAGYHLLTSPDDIMWLLNIRGGDLEYSPLLLSYALVGREQILLFINEGKIPYRIGAAFDRLGIVILPYEDVAEIAASVTSGSSVLLNPQSATVSIYNAISLNSTIIEDISIPTRLKAIKNPAEIENLFRIVVKDGTALVKFFHWFENNHGKIKMTEKSLSDKLFDFRSDQKDFHGLPFATIAAWNENSALPHYTRGEDEGSEIGERGILLIDSGGHYPGGTTDITRTISVGIPSERQKKDFTLILKGHINLALAKFPNCTRGYQLDFIARRSMWGSGLNYAHGTGHGVGYFLNVHEGPQSISPADNKTFIEAGMLTSNEPAIYREGEYGIRTENLILCYEDEETEFGKFLKFETITLCYIEKALIDISLLDQKEIGWLNSYHLEVFDKLSPHLTDEEKLWLREKTSLI